MTDKQIIIDSVDVSGCKCFYINDSHPERKECINPYCKGLCKYNPNCYYKQLKRLEQEKAEIKKYLGISDKTIIQRLEELQEFKDKLKISEYNYKQALDEIEKYLDAQQKYFDGEDYHNLLDIINKAKER